MTLTGSAQITGVIGWPVAHSWSPKVHGFWLDEFGINGAYIPMAVRPDVLALALSALPALGIRGVNITIPHKEKALEIVDEADDLARKIGAVNTISVEKNGQLLGTNTDAYGFIQNLRSNAQQWSVRKPALVLGAGGASRAVCTALIDADVPEVRVCNRTFSRAETLAGDLAGPITAIDWFDRVQASTDVGLLVNTTNLGMVGQTALDMPLTKLPPSAVVTDIVYSPLITPLLENARKRGNVVVDGLGMLLHQAEPGFAEWYGRIPKVSAALRDYVLGQENGS